MQQWMELAFKQRKMIHISRPVPQTSNKRTSKQREESREREKADLGGAPSGFPEHDLFEVIDGLAELQRRRSFPRHVCSRSISDRSLPHNHHRNPIPDRWNPSPPFAPWRYQSDAEEKAEDQMRWGQPLRHRHIYRRSLTRYEATPSPWVCYRSTIAKRSSANVQKAIHRKIF